MKKIAFGLIVACGFLFACTGKKSETKDTSKTTTSSNDTLVIDEGTVTVDSISPDSVQVNVADTAVDLIAVPENQKKKSK